MLPVCPARKRVLKRDGLPGGSGCQSMPVIQGACTIERRFEPSASMTTISAQDSGGFG